LGATEGQKGKISKMDPTTEWQVNASNLSAQNKSIEDQ
jgi:hypothetical protein